MVSLLWSGVPAALLSAMPRENQSPAAKDKKYDARICSANTHAHAHADGWKWYLDTAGCSCSVPRALEDCDWWCGRLQGSGYLPRDGAM